MDSWDWTRNAGHVLWFFTHFISASYTRKFCYCHLFSQILICTYEQKEFIWSNYTWPLSGLFGQMRCCPKLNLLLYTWFYLNSNTELLAMAPICTDTHRDVRAKWFLLSFSRIRTHAYKYKLNSNIYRQSSTWRREYDLYFVRMYVHTHKHTHNYLCL